MKTISCVLGLTTACMLPVGSIAQQAEAGIEQLPGNTVLQLRAPTAPGSEAADLPEEALDLIRREAKPLDAGDGYGHLLQAIGGARIVLLGEATHGTHEFYRARSEITKRLVREKEFDAVAIEGDWPHALQVHRYIRDEQSAGASGESKAAGSADEALGAFRRFPDWMWRNTDVVDLVDWLRAHNSAVSTPQNRVGFYGLDVYSPRASMDAVIAYLQKNDANAAKKARARYACFDRFADAEQEYGQAVVLQRQPGCEREAGQQFDELAAELGPESDAFFHVQQHARVARNAERYYRSMFRSAEESWNLRDTHMADTLDALVRRIEQRKGAPAKIVVWAHNSHVGDAQATEMGDRGEINLGQLVRKRYGREHSFLVGFTTYDGTVMAASAWGEKPNRKMVRPSLPGSFSRVFHDTGIADFMLALRNSASVSQYLEPRRLERAIGVIYRPDTERASHYFNASLARQFDAIVHFDHTRAVQPLDAGNAAAK